jgi:flagellar hook assembly protein FlgD
MYKKVLFLTIFIFLLISYTLAQTITWQSGYPKPLPGGSIELRWNTIPGATSYTIYRIEGNENPYPSYTYVSVTSNVYTDSNTKDGVLYSYVVATTVSGTTYTSPIVSVKADRTKPSIENLSASPNPFSPDGDGFRDKVYISFYISEYATVTVTLKDSSNTTYTLLDWNGRICPAPGTYNVEWDGYFGGSLAQEGIITYTITATDYAGNVNTASSKLILDILDVEVSNLIGTPNPFGSMLDPNKEFYKATYTNPFTDTYGNEFNKDPSFYLDQEGITIGSIALSFDIKPSYASLSNVKISIVDGNSNVVRTMAFENVTSPATFYWYGEKDLELVKDKPEDPTTWYYKIKGNSPGNYKVILEATYTITDTSSGTVINVPLKPLLTNITLGEVIVVPEDVTPPKVLSIYPSSGSLVSNISSVSAVLDDGGGVGPDLEKSTIRVRDNIGRYVGGIQSNNGYDTIYWTFTNTLTTGYYTIEVEPVDKKGNKGSLVTSSFIIDNSSPQFIDVEPKGAIIGASEIRVSYRDEGSGLNLWENYPYSPVGSYIELFTPTGTSQKLLFNKAKTTSILAVADIPSPINMVDGMYNMGIYLVDKAGNSTFTTSTFLLDTTPPYVINSSLNSTTLNYTFTQIQISVGDAGVGIDLSLVKTFVKFSSASGTTIAGPEIAGTYTYTSTIPNNATLILKIPSDYNFAEGDYYLTIRLTDLLGNPFFNTTKITIDLSRPVIISVSPTGNVSKAEKIEVKYIDTGTGVDITKSGINLATPIGNFSLAFDPTLSDKNLLVAPISSDILAQDGVYNMAITLYDMAGNYTATYTSFTLDTSKPYVESTYPTKNAILVLPPSQVSVIVKDNTTGIDTNINKTYIRLRDPNGMEVGTYTYQISSDSRTATLTINTTSYTWTKGIYTVILRATDNTGNSIDDTYTFTLNLEAPSTSFGDVIVTPSIFSPKKEVLRIDFQVQASSGNISEVKIDIYSMNGTLVKIIYSRTFNSLQAQDTVTWDGKDNFGRLVPNGYYLVKVTIKESSGAVKYKFKGFVVIK